MNNRRRRTVKKLALRYFPVFSLLILSIQLLMLFSRKHETWLPEFLTPLQAQTPGTKAILFVIGNQCPAGFQDASAAGYPDLEDNRFPLLVPDTGANSSGDSQLSAMFGGNAVMSWSQMPSHSHAQNTPAGVCGGGQPYYRYTYAGEGTNGCQFPNAGDTSGAGSSQPYWPRYFKLKPCVWVVN